jgi:hypothetical protein
MIGPGWMPSRPRPLVRARRQISSYAPCVQRRTRRARNVTLPATPGALQAVGGPFAERRAKLPLATLLPDRSEGQRRVLSGSLQRWLAQRWMWVQPRLVPLIVAFVGLVGVLNARRYLISLARGNAPQGIYVERAAAPAGATPDRPAPVHDPVARLR